MKNPKREVTIRVEIEKNEKFKFSLIIVATL